MNYKGILLSILRNIKVRGSSATRKLNAELNEKFIEELEKLQEIVENSKI